MTTATLNKDKSSGTRSAESEHRVIKRLLGQLSSRPAIVELRKLLHELDDMLPSHFEGEEGPDGLYEELRIRNPELNRALDALVADHEALRTELAALGGALRGHDEALNALWTAVDDFVTHVLEHEATETELVTHAFYVDLGASG